MNRELKRGYYKWTDENGKQHKVRAEPVEAELDLENLEESNGEPEE